MADSFHIAWYATGFRGEKLERALEDVTATSLRYGATEWSLHRSKDDRYKILQIVGFTNKTEFERWWQGPEMIQFRAITSGWYQVPLVYTPHDLVGGGRVVADAPNGDVQAPAAEPSTAA